MVKQAATGHGRTRVLAFDAEFWREENHVGTVESFKGKKNGGGGDKGALGKDDRGESRPVFVLYCRCVRFLEQIHIKV